MAASDIEVSNKALFLGDLHSCRRHLSDPRGQGGVGMINLLSHTASKVQQKLGGASARSRQKCKLSLLVKRIVLEGTERGHVSVELSRGLKVAATTPMPVKDGLVLVAGVQELSLISTIERDEYNERREKIFKLLVKLVSADQRGKKIEGDSKVLGAIEIDVSAQHGARERVCVQATRP